MYYLSLRINFLFNNVDFRSDFILKELTGAYLYVKLHSLTQLLIVSKIPRIFNSYCKSDFGAFEICVQDVNSFICKLNFKKFYFILFFFKVVLESVLLGLFSIILLLLCF